MGWLGGKKPDRSEDGKGWKDGTSGKGKKKPLPKKTRNVDPKKRKKGL